MHFDSRTDRGIRLETGGDTTAAIINDMAADTRINDPQRCLILKGLTRPSNAARTDAEKRFNCSAD